MNAPKTRVENPMTTRAKVLFQEHIAMASVNGRAFRRLIMDILMSEGCTEAAAATHYNTAKKSSAPVAGLGRAALNPGVRRASAAVRPEDDLQDDDECFTVIELLKHRDGSMSVGRCRSHLMQGDASEDFDNRVMYRPNSTWVMIRGLGPNSGDNFKLSATEEEIKRHTPAVVMVVDKEPALLC